MRCDILKGARDRGTGERVKGGYFGKGWGKSSRGGKDRERGKERGAKSNKGKGAND